MQLNSISTHSGLPPLGGAGLTLIAGTGSVRSVLISPRTWRNVFDFGLSAVIVPGLLLGDSKSPIVSSASSASASVDLTKFSI